jgi:hypothetical protein
MSSGYDIGQFYQPSQISLSSMVNDYGSVLPQLLQYQQQYAPQFTQADLALQQQYLPQYNDMYASEAKRLNPYTYGLQEQLAKQASEGSQNGMPAQLQNSYLNQLRGNVDPNVGSPIAGDYISNNLAQLGEQYRNTYQNLGISLLGKSASPMSTQAYSPSLTSSFDMGQSANADVSAYGAYNQALGNSYYVAPKAQSKTSNVMGTIGGLYGMAAGASLGGPMGAGVGYMAGRSIGGMF